MLVFRHLADHVVEDSSVVEICQLHISVESHPHLERFPCVELLGQKETSSNIILHEEQNYVSNLSVTVLNEP